jgi:hypothetical protein
MTAVIVAAGFIIMYLLSRSGLLPGTGIGGIPGSSTATTGTAAPISTPATPIVITPAGVAAPAGTAASSAASQNLSAGFATTQAVSTASVTAATKISTAVLSAAGAAAPALAAVPVVGAALAAVASILIAESKKRAEAAINENQAVDAAIPPWDAALLQAVQLFNSGQITQAQFGTLMGTPRTQTYFSVPPGICWSNFWQEVGPQVQSGRNGCQSGKVSQTEGKSFCGPSGYGAGCCVAYDDLDNSYGNPKLPNLCVFGALKAACAKPGTPYTATVLAIAPSKYSTYSRGSYTVTLCAPTAA